MVADAIVLLGTAVLVMVVLFAVGSYIISVLAPVVVDLFLGIPQIGALGCNPPAVSDTPPAFDFGDPAYAQMGCIEEYIIYSAFAVVFLGMLVGMIMVIVKGAFMSGSQLQEWMRFFGSAILALILIMVFHNIHDAAAGAITSVATFFAALPHGPADDREEMRDFAGQSLMLPFQKMRDASVTQHECIIPKDIDGDGNVDQYDMDALCVMGNIYSLDFFNIMMIFTIGNMVGIMTTLIVFIAATIKFLLTGVLAVAFPLLFALSKMPVIGRIFNQWVDAYLGLMVAPILLGIVAMVAPVVIMSELDYIHAQVGADSDTESYVAFIMFVAMAYTYLAVIIGSARFLGSVIGSASTVVMGAVVTGVGSLMGTARAAGMGAIGHWSPHAANAFGMGFGAAHMYGGGPGGFYGGSGNFGFAGNHHEAHQGAPANDLIESSTNTTTNQNPEDLPKWDGATERDTEIPTTEPERQEENMDGENRKEAKDAERKAGDKEGGGGSPF